jgi:hypothetical protein
MSREWPGKLDAPAAGSQEAATLGMAARIPTGDRAARTVA